MFHLTQHLADLHEKCNRSYLCVFLIPTSLLGYRPHIIFIPFIQNEVLKNRISLTILTEIPLSKEDPPFKKNQITLGI